MTPQRILWLLPIPAFWPVWRWYAARIADSPEDSCGLLAVATAVALLMRNREQTDVMENESGRSSIRFFLIVVLLLYAATYPFTPPLLRAFLAVAGICLTVPAAAPGRRVPAAVWGLFFLSLPVIPTLQFYLGYPLRRITTFFALPFLHLGGYSVEAQGTTLSWMGESILVDAPCSGVKMMWTGAYVLLAACGFSSFGLSGILRAGALAFILLLIGNAFRVALLFLIETHRPAAWLHEPIGIFVFLWIALMIVWSVRWMANRERFPRPIFSRA